VSILAALAATAALGFLAGRVRARQKIRTLHTEITTLQGEIEVLAGMLRVAQYNADHDQLTSLPNRSYAAKVFLVAELTSQPTILALLDLDRFKHVNDTHGHHTGDELLRVVAERLARAAAVCGGTAARLAGDEFLLLLPVADEEPDLSVAWVLDMLTEPASLRTDDGEVTVTPTASAGIVVYDGTDDDFDTILRHADVALYHAKQRRGSLRAYQPEMRMPPNAARHGPRLRDQHPTDSPEQRGGEVTT